MAKSKIIKELANKEISLEVAFNRLLIIASNIRNTDLIDWATNELNGYSDEAIVPSYRKSGLGHITYSGINGNFQITSQPLPAGAIDNDTIEILKEKIFLQDISSIESFATNDNKNGFIRNITSLASMVYQNTGIQCVNIYMTYSKETFIKILSSIRTKLLKVFIELDNTFGCLDNLDIDNEGKGLESINNKLNVILYEDNSITIGDSNKLKNNIFQKSGGKKQ